MSQFFYTLCIIFGCFFLAFFMINLRYWISGREFRGTCSSAGLELKGKIGECMVCGRKPGEACGNPDKETRLPA